MQHSLLKSKGSIRLTKLIFMLFVIAMTSFTSWAQDRIVSGKVISSDDNSPLPGVNILIKGTTSGTLTDAEGKYQISAGTDATLVFSYVGYSVKEVVVGAQSIIDITLEVDAKQLTEVVVTALGIEKDVSKVGFASQKVVGTELTKAREPNAVNSLVGKVAGLTIGTSPELLGRPNIVLRGNSDVLFVVNGVPVNSDSWNLSADDIESYTVLKGANAAALYGSRGINGAIIVTTKKGVRSSHAIAAKDVTVDFNSSTMVESGFLARPQPQAEYGRGSNGFKYSYGDGLYDNKQRLPEWGPRFEGQPVKQFDSPLDPVTLIRTATPWTARGINNLTNFVEPGVLSTNNIAVTATGERYNLRVSASHTYQKGTGPNTKLNVDNLNLFGGFDLSSKLHLDANLNVNIQHSPNIPDVSYGPNSYMYTFGVYNSSDFDVRDLKNYWKGPMGVTGLIPYAQEYGRENNPYFMAYEWKRGHQKTDIYGSLKLNYKINEHWSVFARSQITTWNQQRTEKVPAGANLNTYLSWYNFGWFGDYRQDDRTVIENNSDALLSYNNKHGAFVISANAGISSRIFDYKSSYATTKGLSSPGVYNFANSGTVVGWSFNSNMQVYSAYYSFDVAYKKYINLSATGRVDQLSTLPKNNQTFFYPSVSVNTILTDYIEGMPSFISFLKVRASYADVKGALTQSQAPSAYQWVTGNSLNGGLLGYGTELYSSYDGPSYGNQSQFSPTNYSNGQPSVSYPTQIANPNIKPYDVQTYEAGLDVRFVENRIGLDVTYFSTVNGPGITALSVSPATGYSSKLFNALTTRKNGIEIALNANPIRRENGLNWNVLVNYFTYKETLESIGQGLNSFTQNGHNYKAGDRMDAFYSTGYVRGPGGAIVYSGNGGPLSSPGGIANNIFLGNFNPDFTFGINNKFSYRSISFSFQFDGRIGGKIYDRIYYQMMNGGTAPETTKGALGAARLAEWKSTNNGTVAPTAAYVGSGVVITGGTPQYANGQLTNLAELTFAPNAKAVTAQSYASSLVGGAFDEAYMIDRSYVKLREVIIGYKIPLSLFGKNQTLVRAASISLVGRNLLYFAARKDFDVDQYASGYNNYSRTLNGSSGNVDLSSPSFRRYGVNINFTF